MTTRNRRPDTRPRKLCGNNLTDHGATHSCELWQDHALTEHSTVDSATGEHIRWNDGVLTPND